MELWKEIEGFDGKILISNQGRVKSNLRNGIILKSQQDAKGYQRVSITTKKIKHTLKVHREVAKAFIPNPNNLPQVNHIDGNKNNNSVDNLEWVTNRENALHALSNGLWDSVIKGAKAVNEKKKKRVIATNGNKTLEFESVSSAEKYFDSRHIVDVLKGRRSRCKGWKFSYGNEVMPNDTEINISS